MNARETQDTSPLEPEPRDPVAPAAPAESRWWSSLWSRLRRWTAEDLRSSAGALAMLLVAYKVFAILTQRLTFSWYSADETCFLWEGWSINRGLAPYRDFIDFKPPLVFFWNALALKLFSLEGQRVRYFFVISVALSLLALAAALLSRKVRKGVVLALLFCIYALWFDPGYHDSSFDDAESIGMTFYLLGIAALLFETKARRTADFLGGVLFSCAVLSKEPFALCVIPAWLSLVCLTGESSGWRAALGRAKFGLAGVGTVFVTLVTYMVSKGCLVAYIEGLRRYIPFTQKVCILYGVWKPSTFFNEWQVRFTKLGDGLVNFNRLGMALPFIVAPFFLSDRKRVLSAGFAGLTAAGGLYAVTLGGCFFLHYFMLGMAGLFFLMAMGALRLSAALDYLGRRGRAYAIATLVLLTGWCLWPRISAESRVTYQPAGPSVSADLIRFVQENSAPTDTIFTTGLPGLYMWSNRADAAREAVFHDAFLEVYQGRTDEEKLAPIYQDLVKNRPKIVVIETKEAEKRIRHVRALVQPFLRRFGYKAVNDHVYLRPD